MTTELKKLYEVLAITNSLLVISMIAIYAISFGKIIPSRGWIVDDIIIGSICLIIIPFIITFFVTRILFLIKRYTPLQKYGAIVFLNSFYFDETIKEIQKYSTLEQMKTEHLGVFKKELLSISKTRLFIYSLLLIS